MKTGILRIAALLVCLASLLTLAVFPAASAPDAAYRSYLIGLGFPESYVDDLSVLHTLHPNWTFEPLMVTQLNSAYTWDYVINMETVDAANRSLVSAGTAYSAYRHPTNSTLYDSGWYQASTLAVKYFMDPRNFLNEKDVFQFEDLGFKDTVTVAQIQTSLAGTFMASSLLDNGKSYAQYFYEVGRELGVSPLHLASRARQEQGVTGNGAQISGSCGDRLWYYYNNKTQIDTTDNTIVYAPLTGHSEMSLKQYNGLYNFYNINASGTGKFAILLGAMQEAMTGTASKSLEWGNGGRWDTRWKSIYGGAYKLRGSYIGNYQNTLYLQKWNVDNRSRTETGSSRNFWGQYMQNIGAALSEARNTYTSLSAGNCLDCAYTFLIPVYAGMPAAASIDPANGSCIDYATSTLKYSYVSQLNTVAGATPVRNTYVSTQLDCSAGDIVRLQGWSVHTNGLLGYEYSIDGGAWTRTAASHSNEVANANPGFIRCSAATALNSFSADISTLGLSVGKHTITLRGYADFNAADVNINNNRYYLIGVIDLNIKANAPVTVTVQDISGTRNESALRGSVYTMPAASVSPKKNTYFAGWRIVMGGVKSFLPTGAGITVSDSMTLTPVYAELSMRRGASVKISDVSLLRYTAALGYDGYAALTEAAGASNVTLGMVICRTPSESSGITSLNPDILVSHGIAYKKTTSTTWCQNASYGGYLGFTGDSDAIDAANYTTSFSATAYIHITYSNASSAYICASYDAGRSARSVRSVAAAALADTAKSYTEINKATLGRLAK